MKYYLPIFLLSIFSTLLFASNGITRSSEVEKLCKKKSEQLLIEQDITVQKWTAQHFNGERTFNIDGVWITNAGDYLVECELPFASDRSALMMEITKVK